MIGFSSRTPPSASRDPLFFLSGSCSPAPGSPPRTSLGLVWIHWLLSGPQMPQASLTLLQRAGLMPPAPKPSPQKTSPLAASLSTHLLPNQQDQNNSTGKSSLDALGPLTN